MLEYISVEKIDPHPDNPRKDLGDLSELAESIRAKGILQNLTLVPSPADPGRYRVVIGHRRLAAAKLAGLKEVPCSISDMDHKEQVATMLLENMQRSDLTPYEQAQGFQMMLNLGETVSGIAEKTGFSSTTVRHRVKLLELDQKKLKESSARGATLQDYLELEKIEDVKTRNAVLEKVGTSNFDYELKRALDHEESAKKMARIVASIEKFAARVDKAADDLKWFASYYPSSDRQVEVPQDADKAEYFYKVDPYYVTVYRKGEQAAVNDPEAEKRKELDERRAKLDEIKRRAFSLRMDFMKKFAGAKKQTPVVMEYAVRAFFTEYITMDSELFSDVLGLKVDGNSDWDYDGLSKQFKVPMETVLAAAVYGALENPTHSYYAWNGTYKDDENLDTVYDFLVKLGYPVSDEEQAMRDGTHELFVKIESKGE